MPDLEAGRALALAVLLAALPASAQTMYKWVDERGVTHFSEHPPADAKSEKKATKVSPRVTPPSNPGAYDPNAWKSKDADSRKARVERSEQAQGEAKDAARMAETCRRARQQLGILQTAAPVYTTNPDGSRTYMEDKERAAEIARAREVADKACR